MCLLHKNGQSCIMWLYDLTIRYCIVAYCWPFSACIPSSSCAVSGMSFLVVMCTVYIIIFIVCHMLSAFPISCFYPWGGRCKPSGVKCDEAHSLLVWARSFCVWLSLCWSGGCPPMFCGPLWFCVGWSVFCFCVRLYLSTWLWLVTDGLLSLGRQAGLCCC